MLVQRGVLHHGKRKSVPGTMDFLRLQVGLYEWAACLSIGPVSLCLCYAESQSVANTSVNVDASVNELFGLLKASFSASDDYQKLFSGGHSGTFGYVGTTAVCTAYKASWNEFFFQPNLTMDFQAAVAGLGGDVSYLQFVSAFGPSGCLWLHLCCADFDGSNSESNKALDMVQ
jgi:hypothetical protein